MDQWAIVCRCEELTRVEIEEAVQDGARTPDDVKRITRCGMGHCQSKFCGSTVQAIIEEMTGLSPGAVAPPRLRPPVRPVPLGGLAAGSQGEGQPGLLKRLFGSSHRAEESQ